MNQTFARPEPWLLDPIRSGGTTLTGPGAEHAVIPAPASADTVTGVIMGNVITPMNRGDSRADEAVVLSDDACFRDLRN